MLRSLDGHSDKDKKLIIHIITSSDNISNLILINSGAGFKEYCSPFVSKAYRHHLIPN